MFDCNYLNQLKNSDQTRSKKYTCVEENRLKMKYLIDIKSLFKWQFNKLILII